MSISVGSLTMLQGYVAKGYSATAIRNIMGNAIPQEAVQSMVAAKRCVLDLERQAETGRQHKAAERARVEAAEKSRREKERARAAAMYRVIPVLGSGVFIKDIIAKTAHKYGLSIGDLTGAGRNRELTVPRHEAMYLCARDTTLSLPAIGRRLCRDHTTVIHGIRQHAKRNGLPLPRGMKPEGAPA